MSLSPRASRLLMGSAALLLAGALGMLALVPGGSDTAEHFAPGWQILRPPHDVNALVMHRGGVLAGGRDGLTAFTLDGSGRAAFADGAPDMTYVKALLVDRAGALWIGHRGGLARHDGTGWSLLPADADTPPGPVAALIELRDGGLLAGGEAGLVAVTRNGFEPIALPDAFAASSVSSLFEDVGGRLWVGFSSPTRGGLLVRDGDAWHEIGLDQGLVHRAINAIGADGAGRILVASGYSGRGGACRLEERSDLGSWVCLTETDGLASDMVRLAHEDSHGQVWYGSEFRGLAVASGGRMLRYGPADGMAGTELKAFFEDPEGNLWLGCDKGLTRIDAANAEVSANGGGA